MLRRKTKLELISENESLQRRLKDLEESEPYRLKILDVALEAIASIDSKHRIVLFNGGAENIFGFTAREVLDQHLDLLLPSTVKALH
ncbi:MAG: PAS domain S-box protein, partial [Pseudomonadales bacterium]|nr:PAS domain S-box protein [Pseudomonadales bacterium]